MRSTSFGTSLNKLAREIARAKREKNRAIARQEAEDNRRLRDAHRQTTLAVKEAKRLYFEDRIEEAEHLTRSVIDNIDKIDTLLVRALLLSPKEKLLQKLKIEFIPNHFDERLWKATPPDPKDFIVEPPGFFKKIFTGAMNKYEEAVEEKKKKFDEEYKKYQKWQKDRLEAFQIFREQEEERKQDVKEQEYQNHIFISEAENLNHDAIVEYYEKLLQYNLVEDIDAVSVTVGYSVNSKHLVVDLDLPDIDVIPSEVKFKYIKSRDEIDTTMITLAKRKLLYTSLISQVALKGIDTIFRGGIGVVDCLTLNGMLDAVDPATGQNIRPCLVSVRVTLDVFQSLNLAAVQPIQCLRSLKASVSRSPDELVPVKPIVEMNMVDPRFVDSLDVISGLDQRENLMDLTPNEFENLITNLFAKMGLDTKQT